MKKYYLFMITILAVVATFDAVPSFGQQLAFPGAEGFGRFTTGGRGGIVYEVTNLDNSGPGSLRQGLEMAGARTIVFKVSGNIHLETDIRIRNGDLTVAGQTAPGDGITIKGSGLVIDANNIIIRYIRIRPGDILSRELDAMWGREQSDIILDHLSLSWSTDEVGSFYDNERFTLQWSILSESLYESVHDKGRHGYGGIWGGKNGATFHHNLLAHHSSRNPRFNGARYTTTPETELVDFRNNVLYNWGGNSAYGGENGKHNMVANYYKPGPATSGDKRHRIINPDYSADGWYVADNFVVGNPTVTADNWAGGVQGVTAAELDEIKAMAPFEVAPVETQTAENAFISVLEEAGASYRRDAVDERIIEETRTGNTTYGGAYGAGKGIIDTQETVGGWPTLFQAPVPEDTDSDGMPDEWETAAGLDPADPTDRNGDRDSDGYTNLEEYLNSILDSEAPSFLRYPTELAIANTSRKIVELEWVNNAEGNVQIVVERSTDSITYEAIDSLAGNLTSYIDEVVSSGQVYYYRLKVINGEEESSYSSIVSGNTQAAFLKPGQPTPVTGSTDISAERVDFRWLSDAPSYSFYLGTSAGNLELQDSGISSRSYTVNELSPATEYFWRVDGVGEDGFTISSDVWSFTTTEITSVDAEEFVEYFRCSPNPFSENLKIGFELLRQQSVELSLYGMDGRKVRTLLKSTLAPGTHQVEVSGKGLQEGVYLCVLQTSDFKLVRRVVYLGR